MKQPLFVFAQEVILGAWKPEDLPEQAHRAMSAHRRMLAIRPSAPTAVEPAQDAVYAELPTGWSIRPSQIYPGAFCIEGPGSSTLINTADNLHPLFAAISALKGNP